MAEVTSAVDLALRSQRREAAVHNCEDGENGHHDKLRVGRHRLNRRKKIVRNAGSGSNPHLLLACTHSHRSN